jgi:hypothetical protein
MEGEWHMPSDKELVGSKPTLVVTERGDLSLPLSSYRQGFAHLLDLAAPPVSISVLPPGAPTVIGFVRTGQSLRNATAAWKSRK